MQTLLQHVEKFRRRPQTTVERPPFQVRQQTAASSWADLSSRPCPRIERSNEFAQMCRPDGAQHEAWTVFALFTLLAPSGGSWGYRHSFPCGHLHSITMQGLLYAFPRVNTEGQTPQKKAPAATQMKEISEA